MCHRPQHKRCMRETRAVIDRQVTCWPTEYGPLRGGVAGLRAVGYIPTATNTEALMKPALTPARSVMCHVEVVCRGKEVLSWKPACTCRIVLSMLPNCDTLRDHWICRASTCVRGFLRTPMCAHAHRRDPNAHARAHTFPRREPIS